MLEEGITRFQNFLLELQDRICSALEEADGSQRFGADRWDRPEGGGGLTRVLKGER